MGRVKAMWEDMIEQVAEDYLADKINEKELADRLADLNVGQDDIELWIDALNEEKEIA